MGGSYSHSSHPADAFDDSMQEMQETKVRPKHKLYCGAMQVVHLKWECTGALTIIEGNYKIDYFNIDASRRQNRLCNSVIIVKVNKMKERAETGGRGPCWADLPLWRIQPEQPWEQWQPFQLTSMMKEE